MRKKLLISLVALAVMTAFSNKPPTRPTSVCYWLIYISGDQESLSNYLIRTSPQAGCVGSDVLCWIKICTPDGTLSQAVFNEAFEYLDVISDWWDSLDDDQEATVTVGAYTYTLEKQSDS
jgi:hypothetical protein